jgi:hypothetical protein
MKEKFNRDSIHERPLSQRKSKLEIERDAIDPFQYRPDLSLQAEADVNAAADDIRAARSRGSPVILAFGAHTIKNGLAPVLVRLMTGGWINHFATNGAGIIHDWEFAYQGKSAEDVRRYVAEGQFGIWQETGFYINLALAIGAWKGMGYGESIGALIADDGVIVPEDSELVAAMHKGQNKKATEEELEKAAAAADLRALIRHFKLKAGKLAVDHPYKKFSLSYGAFANNVPFTCHPMFGHDIIYTHPMNRGSVVGRTAEVDFLFFVDSISHLEEGVYLSVGSAVMSPMIFEKSLSMARNVAHSRGMSIENFSIHVVDLAKSDWDWQSNGEPPQDNPAYYLRFNKTFSRMGGKMTYTSADNRSWLVALLRALEQE